MYRFIKSLSTKELFAEQLPVFAAAFLIAELFYKFHSFTLECLAFLATWYGLDALRGFVVRLLAPGPKEADHSGQP